MRVKNRHINLIYMIILTLISGYGIYMTMGMSRGEFNVLPMYYTTLSNIICFVYFLVSSIKGAIVIATKQPKSAYMTVLPRFKGSIVMCITVTFLIYHFLLFNGSFYVPGTTSIDWVNLILHYIVPVLVILHWVIFDKKGIFSKTDPLIWTVIPLAYMVYTFINAAVGGVLFYGDQRYPYYFINPDIVGWGRVATYVVVLFAFFILLGYIIVFVDKLMAKVAKD